MTTPNFAELKEKLIRFDSDDITLNKMIKDENYAWAAYDKMSHIEKVEAHDALLDIANYQHTKSAAIISELIEIISFQDNKISELLNYLHHNEDNLVGDDLIGDQRFTKRFNNYTKSTSDVLSETNTRLQKLRDGK